MLANGAPAKVDPFSLSAPGRAPSGAWRWQSVAVALTVGVDTDVDIDIYIANGTLGSLPYLHGHMVDLWLFVSEWDS